MEYKKKICNVCGENTYIFSKGRCKICASKDYAKKTQENKSKTPKTNSVEKSNLSPFFSYHISRIEKNNICQICQCKITPSHFHVAHILPKSKYKSVSNNLDNALYLCTSILGGNGCHETFDNNQNDIEFLSELNIIEDVLFKFNKIKKFLTDIEKSKVEYRTLEMISTME